MIGSLKERVDGIKQQRYKQNLPVEERIALKELQNDTDIVIKKADKGSCLVIENRDDYISDGLAHLADKEIYEEIEVNYTKDIAQAINDTVKRALAKGTLSKDMASYLQRGVSSCILFGTYMVHPTNWDNES